MSRYIGPELPPNFKTSDESSAPEDHLSSEVSSEQRAIGPSLPPGLTSPASDRQNEDSEDEFGPALPPGFEKAPSEQEHRRHLSLSADEEDDVVGPVPEGQEDKNHQYDLSDRKFRKQHISKREKWMLEPPKALSKTLPTKIQTKSVTKFSQKSSKNEAPLSKEQKLEQKLIAEKEGKMREFLDKYEKSNKRSTSLLEQHRKDRDKNKKLKPDTTQRREFDRDKDLNVPRMDSKMKNSFINEASSTFSNRFSGGKFEKFL